MSKFLQVVELELRKLMFCDYANPKADSRNYSEVQELETLTGVVERALNEFNSMSRKPGELFLFR